MPGFLINSAADLRALLERVEHPNCMAQLDFYHMACQGLDLPDCIARLAGRIGHVQFADCPGAARPVQARWTSRRRCRRCRPAATGLAGRRIQPGEQGSGQPRLARRMARR